jgi:hypothetical protein
MFQLGDIRKSRIYREAMESVGRRMDRRRCLVARRRT